MDNSDTKPKKLDFERDTFNRESVFKVPSDVTNHQSSIISNKTRSTQSLNMNNSEKSEGIFADDEESSLDSDFSVTSEDTVSVYLRLKPTTLPIPGAYSFSTNNVSLNVSLKGNQLYSEREYTFTSILDQSVTQKALYDTCVRPILDSPFSSSGAVFASYGISNSGKTYTILGEKSAGVVPRAITQVFSKYQNHIARYPCIKVVKDQIQILDDAQVEIEIDSVQDFISECEKQLEKQHNGKRYGNWIEEITTEHQFEADTVLPEYQRFYIWLSFVEIYNEKIIDLFKSTKNASSTSTHPLRVISNNGDSYILGLTCLPVSTLETAMNLLQHGLRRVTYASTEVNAHSSRSHTIFTINMISECADKFEFSSYKFCDLAGAERTSKTKNVGNRLKESGVINTSLLVLGRCLEAVQANQKPDKKKKAVVPVRDSKLTFLLQSSLCGQEKFVMIVNLLPTTECLEENVNVLYFGSIANKIVTRPVQPRRVSRASARYSYFKQNTILSPQKMNLSSNESFTDRDESDLDLSYERNNMTSEELRHELRKKDLECALLREIIERKERELLNKERIILQESAQKQNIDREKYKEYFESKEQIITTRYEAKMENMRVSHKRKLDNLEDEIAFLERENRKLKTKLGMNCDNDIIDLDDSDQENTSP